MKFVFSIASLRRCLIVLFAMMVGGCAKEQVAEAATTADAKTTSQTGGKKVGEGGGRSGRGGRGGSGQKQSVEVIAISRRDLSESLRVVGSLAANETATIRPEMNGLQKLIAKYVPEVG